MGFYKKNLLRDFFLDKKREKAKLEAEMKFQVTLKMNVPACEPKNGSSVTTMCGQYFVNITDFCNSFNALTEDLTPGVEVPVVITKGLRAKDFKLVVKSIKLQDLFFYGSVDGRYISYLDLWAILKLKQRSTTKNDYEMAKLVFSNLFKYKIRFKV